MIKFTFSDRELPLLSKKLTPLRNSANILKLFNGANLSEPIGYLINQPPGIIHDPVQVLLSQVLSFRFGTVQPSLDIGR